MGNNYNFKHGHRSNRKHTPEYQAYMHAKHRCTNPHCHNWQYWGGRGILFKFTSFEQFFAEIGPRPAGLRLDRIDNNGHYESGNVKWSTPTESNHNKRQRQSKKGKANTEKSESVKSESAQAASNLSREKPTQSRNLPCLKYSRCTLA